MFGNDDNQKQQPKDTTGVMPAIMPDPITMAGLSGDSPAPNPVFGAPSIPATPSLDTPVSDSTESSDSVAANDRSSPAVLLRSDDAPDAGDIAPAADSPQADDDLLKLKQQALQHLTPLVSHLDQTPEEKFRTTMMMIQASDDKSLVKTAFESAQLITDEKARAQALLDVINEINYFTQHSAS